MKGHNIGLSAEIKKGGDITRVATTPIDSYVKLDHIVDGEVNQSTIVPFKSFTMNFIKLLESRFSDADVSGTGVDINAQDIVLMDNVGSTSSGSIAGLATYVTLNGMSPLAPADDVGIVIGDSNTAFSPTQYRINKISDSVMADNVDSVNSAVSISGNIATYSIASIFTNKSMSETAHVREAGLYGQMKEIAADEESIAQTPGKYVMMARDVLGTTFDIAPGESIKITYEFNFYVGGRIMFTNNFMDSFIGAIWNTSVINITHDGTLKNTLTVLDPLFDNEDGTYSPINGLTTVAGIDVATIGILPTTDNSVVLSNTKLDYSPTIYTTDFTLSACAVSVANNMVKTTRTFTNDSGSTTVVIRRFILRSENGLNLAYVEPATALTLLPGESATIDIYIDFGL